MSAIERRADIAGLGADLYSGLDQRPTSQDVRGFYPYDNDARTLDDHVDGSVGGVGDTCGRANRQYLERQLQHYGSGKGVQTETESIQTGTAGTMACAEI